jgi:hypothetical protein
MKPLDAGIDIANQFAAALGHENGNAVVVELRAEEPRISLFRIAADRHEALRVELEMRTHQQRAELAESGQIGRRSAPNADRLGRG